MSPEYRIWKGMIQRCTDPHRKAYRNYIGRGIKVCERWKSFSLFFADMGPKPTPKHTIERINNEGDYEPTNCRWATAKEQSRNRRNNHKLSLNGVTLIVSQWAEKLSVHPDTLNHRLHRGWSDERTLTQPLRSSPYGTHK